jgi:MULE transposase domain
MKYTILSEPGNKSEYHYFKCVAWAWGSYIEAFQYLRPVISIDVAFLSGRYEERLLMACGYDTENQLIPLAFTLVEKENRENWGVASSRKLENCSANHDKLRLYRDYLYTPYPVTVRFLLNHVEPVKDLPKAYTIKSIQSLSKMSVTGMPSISNPHRQATSCSVTVSSPTGM